jgi:hypothetical protein
MYTIIFLIVVAATDSQAETQGQPSKTSATDAVKREPEAGSHND